ncbi:tetratricopeptide (TPR) repeat protein [Phyllobacterium sp. 1468]|uniref:tetratricopeptide repeat protein n=1 Tax=Phyllobacterium sp. 1468 TaxID=2817759 RepID=UPI00285D63FA|nr:tetratricopeptide repeat protein [Phyllobacterium sp. 1468]MDR6632055.1 tetratricopeptide (TPR) repeat protein [Phyllobacterium sp. 1468]
MKKSTLLILPTIAAFAGLVAVQLDYVPALATTNGSVRSAMLESSDPPPDAQADDNYVVAQSGRAPKTQAPKPAAPAPGAATAPKVDETALRYFARQGDKRRLEAEIARLRALYPGWTPPADPTSVMPQADTALDAMWKLYAAGKLPELRKAIQERQTSEPGWKPPGDMLQLVELAESREQLINASDLKQYDTVIRIGSSHNSLLTCSDVDVLWRVAEAFAKTDRVARAKDAYGYVLDNCTKPDERLATVQKALPLLSRADLDALLAREKTNPDGSKEFDTIHNDLARKAVADAGADPKLTVPPADVSRVEKLANDVVEPSDPLILGWYYLRRNDPVAAERWFRLSHDRENAASSSQGLALAMIALSRPAEAEGTIYEWRDSSDGAKAVYMAAVANLLAQDPPVEIAPAILQRMVPEVMKAKDANAAQQLGWYAYLLNQFETASGWFSTALLWKPDDEPSSYGLVLTREQLGDTAGVADIQRRWAGKSDRIARLGELRNTRQRGLVPSPERFGTDTSTANQPVTQPTTNPGAPAAALPQDSSVAAANPLSTTPAPTLAERVAETIARTRVIQSQNQTEPVQASPEPRRPRPPQQTAVNTSQRASRGCTTTIDPQTLTPDAALTRGWCLMDMNRPLEAAAAFERGLLSRSEAAKSDAAYGQSLAYLRVGLADKAAVAASKARQKHSRQIELDTALLASRATDSFTAGRYTEALLALDQRARIAPERNDLMVLRGYAYMNLNRLADAQRVFEAVAATGSKDGLRGMATIRAIRNKEY